MAEVNATNIYYEVQGTGEPLVVIHGLGADVSESRITTDPLAEHFRLLTFDNRGAGRSDKPDVPYSIEMLASDTAELMRAAGFVKASVLGISLGGRIALELALKRPDLVKKLVLVSTGARVQNRWVRAVLTRPPPRVLSRGKYPQPRYAFLRQREASTNYDASERLGDIKGPTLILHGEHDRVAPLAIAEELHRGIAGSELITFKGGHIFFLLRERQRFSKTVQDFVSS